MNSSARPTIVVGVTGSRASAAALTWAAAEARSRHADLLVVRAWQPGQLTSFTVQVSRHDRRQWQQAVTSDLAVLLRAAFGPDEPRGLRSVVIEGTAERVLADASAGADLLVLGSTSEPTLSGRSIGPVVRSCLSRAHCPVVVIGPEGPARPGESAGARPARTSEHVRGHGVPLRRGTRDAGRGASGVLAAVVPRPRADK
jgi:nucleotide-binding universal stress UspA family protein